MKSIVIISKAFVLVLFFGLPIMFMGLLIQNWPGAALGFVLAGLACLFVSMMSESITIKFYKAKKSRGDDNIYETIRYKGNWRVATFSDSSINVVVSRALFGRGIVLLSHGALSLLTKEELYVLLLNCEKRLFSRGIVFSSFCGVVASLFFRLFLGFWKKPDLNNLENDNFTKGAELRLSPVGAIFFLILRSWLMWILNLGRICGDPPLMTSRERETWVSVKHKMKRFLPLQNYDPFGGVFNYSIFIW